MNSLPKFAKTGLASVAGKELGSTLGFGCMGITAFYGDPMPHVKAMELLKAVYDGGCRHFDTAEVYRTGDLYNEAVLGDFFKAVPRESFTVATKYWPFNYEGRADYESVKAALTASLNRLQIEYVDLYYCHRITTLEGAMEFGETCKRLVKEGLIREVGLSEIGPAWLKKVHEQACPIAAIQQEWSLMTRNLEDELIPMCKDLGIAVVAYSPLARNLLAVKQEVAPSDWRGNHPRYQAENLKANNAIVDVLESLSHKYKCTPAQLALGWLFSKAEQMGVSVVPIPGTTKVHRAVSNMGSTKVEIKDPDDMALLDGLVDQVAGARGTEEYVNMGFEAKN